MLSIAATGLVALTFQPVRDRVQRFANRIVYGERSTPYEVLTRFNERVGTTYATEDVLPRTARVIAEGVNAERATIWLHLADELRPDSGVAGARSEHRRPCPSTATRSRRSSAITSRPCATAASSSAPSRSTSAGTSR